MFKNRSLTKELIDLGPDYYSLEEYKDCMQQLFQVNHFFGFFRDTVHLLKKVSPQSTLLDIGCGNGLFLLHLNKIHPQMNLVGVDISAEAINLAQELKIEWLKQSLNQNVHFVLTEKSLPIADKSVDIVLATLLCHHLSNEELIVFLRNMNQLAPKMIILNDLHRHWLAYYGYALINRWLFTNRLINHDGLLSIRRGFILSEWKNLLDQAGIKNYQIKWRFPFRWQILIYP